MDRIAIFLFLFGFVMIVGVFLSIFWTRSVVVRWRKVKGRWRWNEDRALILSASIALSSTGLMMVYGGHLLFNMFYNLSPTLQNGEAWPVAIGLVLFLTGNLLLVWLADLEIDPPRWGWLKGMALIAAAWLAASIYLAPLIPLAPNAAETKANDIGKMIIEAGD